jgi:hypothetical protein
MRAYVLTSGVIFGLLVLAHVLRVVAEGSHVVRDPFFAVTTLIAASLAGWAFRLLRLH